MVNTDDSRQIHSHDSYIIIISGNTRTQQYSFIHVNNTRYDQPSYGKQYLLHHKFFVATKAPTTIQLPFGGEPNCMMFGRLLG